MSPPQPRPTASLPASALGPEAPGSAARGTRSATRSSINPNVIATRRGPVTEGCRATTLLRAQAPRSSARPDGKRPGMEPQLPSNANRRPRDRLHAQHAPALPARGRCCRGLPLRAEAPLPDAAALRGHRRSGARFAEGVRRIRGRPHRPSPQGPRPTLAASIHSDPSRFPRPRRARRVVRNGSSRRAPCSTPTTRIGCG